MKMSKIEAVEDINAFFANLGNRNKLYQVKVGNKTYKNMELKYVKTEDNPETFIFEERK